MPRVDIAPIAARGLNTDKAAPTPTAPMSASHWLSESIVRIVRYRWAGWSPSQIIASSALSTCSASPTFWTTLNAPPITSPTGLVNASYHCVSSR